MHELGIVFHVAEMVEKIAKEHNASHVKKVVLQVGEVSMVVNAELTDVWNWNCKKSTVLKDCVLEIEPIKAVTFCESCHAEYETVKYGKVCPHCKSMNTYLLRGNETTLKNIEVD